MNSQVLLGYFKYKGMWLTREIYAHLVTKMIVQSKHNNMCDNVKFAT